MRKFNLKISTFLAVWLFSSSLLAQAPSWGLGTFGNIGYIGKITSESIILDDTSFRLSATARFSTVGNTNAGLSKAKKGQLVGYNFLVVNNRFIVDRMWLIPENEYSLYRR